jgi:RNA polymerase-binding transcription factor DksA
MHKTTKSQRRRAGDTLTRKQVLELRGQLRDELAWLQQRLQKRVPGDVPAREYAERCAQVLIALDRIEDGTYGRCRVCGEPIPFLRLECVPDTSRCVTCHAAGLSTTGWHS